MRKAVIAALSLLLLGSPVLAETKTEVARHALEKERLDLIMADTQARLTINKEFSDADETEWKAVSDVLVPNGTDPTADETTKLLDCLNKQIVALGGSAQLSDDDLNKVATLLFQLVGQ